ncbi:MAG: DinB family protein [Actinobacteria bacterium]|jgi:hypothetical protein|nr:DinB family protein [Actinomycetota bacterium]
MAIKRSVLMVELLMSADRVISAAQEAPAEPRGDGWPAATVVGHLSQVDTEVWLPRLDQMVIGRQEGMTPSFAWWEPEAEQTLVRFAGMTADDAGAQLLASRTLLLHRLRELTDDDWDARAEHEAFGSLDVEGLMLQVLSHDEEHRASILLGQPEV